MVFQKGNQYGKMLKGKPKKKEHKEKISLAHMGKSSHRKNLSMTEEYGKKRSQQIKEKISKNTKIAMKNLSPRKKEKLRWARGRKLTEEHKRKISPLGRRHTEITKKKIREASINYLKKQHDSSAITYIRIGKNEKKILDVLENYFNLKLIRQFEVDGYFIDGYDIINKVAVEIDEPHHKFFKEKDLLREKYIKNKLNCVFVRVEV